MATIDAAWQLADQEIIKSINALSATVDANKTEAAANLKTAVDAITAELAAKQTLIETNDAAIKALLETKVSELNKLIEGNAASILAANKTIADNKAAQDAANTVMQNDIAKNAKDIIAQGKDITNLDDAIKAIKKALGDDTAETLKAYAKSIAESEALQAKLEAEGYADKKDAALNLTLMDAIKKQAAQDEKAWTAAIDLAIENLVTTYKLASLNEYIKTTAEAAQTAAEKNAAVKAQEIANKALADAKAYTDVLAQTLKDNYTTTTDMQTAIETAKKAATSQAYLDVLNTLLRDYDEWYNLNDENKMNLELTPTIIELTKAAVEKYGLTKANAQDLIDANLKAWLEKPKGTGTYTAEGKEIMTPAGEIMAEILAAAEALQQEFTAKYNALDLRVADIEKILGVTLNADGDSVLAGKIFTNTVKALIANSPTADAVATLKKQIEGDEASGLLTKINAAQNKADQNAGNIALISATINNINTSFSGLTEKPKADAASEDAAIADVLKDFELNIQKLVDRVNYNSQVIDNLGNTVETYVNKFLAEKVNTMITSINLFANQHMAERDEQYKLAQWDGSKWIYPFGYDNFDHTLTFMYAIESGLYSSYCPDAEGNKTLSQEKWNYPDGLIKQLKTISSTRDQQYPNDYDFSYDEGGFTGDAADFDFVDGRYRSYEDSILVRVSPTNADLAKAEIALLNSKGEDIIDAGLVELRSVTRYTRNTYIVREDTRAAEGNETGLWVIKFKLNDSQVGKLWDKYAYAKTTKDNTEQLTGSILYAVAVKNTDFSTGAADEKDRYVVSEYDLDLDTTEPEHAWHFTVGGESIDDIHNRYIMAEEAPNGETSWTDDPENYTSTFRYELTWHDLKCDAPAATPGQSTTPVVIDDTHPAYYTYCFDCWCLPTGQINPDCKDKDYNYKHPAYSSILFKGEMDNYTDVEQKGVNTCDRHAHTFSDMTGQRQMNGIDNRHEKDFLHITFDVPASQVPGVADDGYMWAKIPIKFDLTNNCGVPTPIRGFFVTLDNHFAIESQNSEINAWAQYIYKNVAAYNYDHHKKKTVAADETDAVIDRKIYLQPGNEGYIYIKDAANILNDEIVGFRVHAVNLDGTLVDPDGRAFYVKIGKKTLNHQLSFDITADTLESFAVQNPDAAGNNPIAAYNELMYAEGSSDRFFNQPAYNSSYVDSRVYKAVFTWRADNPAIRGWKTNATNAWIPVEGTGKGVENAYGAEHAVVINADPNATEQYVYNSANFDVEKFFDFYFSENKTADIEDNKDNNWMRFTSTKTLQNPNVKTMSMRASIKAGMANRLLDGGIYKIRMTILRNDAQTVWSIVNTYDIDITKVMPEDMPKAFAVKSNQLTDGKWTFNVRPYAGADFTATATTDPWKITWTDFVIKFEKDDAGNVTNNFADLFNADKFKDKNDTEKESNLHNYRWAMDTRMYNFEGIFEGLYIDELDANGNKTGKKTIDKNYFFIFKNSGSFVGAEEAIAGGKSAEEADKANAAKDAIAVFDQNYDLTKLNPGTDNSALTHEKGAYTLPLIHWSHLNLSEGKEIKAGYIYRKISANLDETGKQFLAPEDDKIGMSGLSVANQDYEIKNPVDVKLGANRDGAALKAYYKCALGNAITFTTDAAVIAANKFVYNQDISVEAKNDKFTLSDAKWEPTNADRHFFNTLFKSTWKTTDAGTLADWIATPWCWIDVNSLAFTATEPAGFIYTNYYDKPYFTVGTAAFDPMTNTFQEISGIKMERDARNEGLNAFSATVKGYFSFNIYDIWFHSKTVKIKVEVSPKPNGTSRQAK